MRVSKANLSDFKKIADTVPGMIAVYNIQTGEYLYVNNAIRKILGYDPSDFMNQGFPFVISLVHPDDLDELVRKNTEAMELANRKTSRTDSDPIFTFEYRMHAKDGSWKWLHTDANVFSRSATGEVEVVLNISIDITGRKKAEEGEEVFREMAEKLQMNEERLRLAMDAGKLGAWDWDIMHNKVSWTERTYELHGLKHGEFDGSVEAFAKLLHPEDRPKMLKSITKAVEEAASFTGEFRVVLPNGKSRWLFTEGKAIAGKKGKAVRMLGVTFDITHRKEAERELMFREQQFRTLTNFAPVGIFQTDAEGNCIFVNKQWTKISGITEKEAMGTGWVKAMHIEDRERVAKEWYEAAKLEKPFSSVYRFATPGGKITWLHGNAIGLRDVNGKVTTYMGTITDITEERKKMENKDEFMGIVSHELKTPVTSLKAYTQVLQKRFTKVGDPTLSSYFGKMNVQINKLITLIEDLLDVTKIDRGKLKFNEEFFVLDDMIDLVIEEVQRTTISHKIIKRGEARKKIFGDSDRIGQVLINLLSNAIKYSPNANKVVVKTRVNKKDIVVSVKDYGIGIAKREQKRIFERFYRESDVSGQPFPGLGLGLYISSQIIERHGGKIWVESDKGKGSTFYFTLPVKR